MKKILLRFGLGAAAVLLLLFIFLWIELRTPETRIAAVAAAPGATGAEIVLRDVTVITPGVERRAGQTVTIRDGRIVRIEPAAVGGAGGEASPYAGAFLLPGLLDLHHHLPPGNVLKLSGLACLLNLAYGVTTVRDVGDADGTGVAGARAGIAAGDFPGPRIFACGPFIDGGQPRWSNSVHMSGPQDAARIVAELAQKGFDCVKSYEDLTVEDIRALVAAARARGLPVLGHVPAQLSYEEALIPNVQHFLGVPPPASLKRDHIVDRTTDWHAVDEARLDRIVAVTLEHGIVNTPTLVAGQQLLLYRDYPAALRDPVVRLLPRMYREVAWHPQEGLAIYRNLSAADLARASDAEAKKKELVRRLYQAGASLRIGTDTPQPFVVPGAAVHEEMRLFHEAGVPAEAVWAIATWQGAAELKVPLLGTVREGAPADLLLFRRDPTQDLGALDTLAAVIVQGRLYTKQQLDDDLAAYVRHFESPVVDNLSVTMARMILDATLKRDY